MSMILYPVLMKALSSDIIDVSGLACPIAAKIVPGLWQAKHDKSGMSSKSPIEFQ